MDIRVYSKSAGTGSVEGHSRGACKVSPRNRHRRSHWPAGGREGTDSGGGRHDEIGRALTRTPRISDTDLAASGPARHGDGDLGIQIHCEISGRRSIKCDHRATREVAPGDGH